MPTIRQYFYKTIKNFFLIITATVVFILAIIAIGWIVPTKVYNGIVFYSLYFVNEIGIGVAALIAIFFGYKIFRIYKTEKSFGSELIKMSPSIIISLLIISYVAIFMDESFDSTDCKNFNYNEKLNGGIKEFNGKQYIVNICGSGVNDNHFFGDSMDKVQLTILNNQGEVLAKRRYKVFWESRPGHEPITMEKDSITYQDDEKQQDYTIAIPPTRIDWIRARLPYLKIE